MSVKSTIFGFGRELVIVKGTVCINVLRNPDVIYLESSRIIAQEVSRGLLTGRSRVLAYRPDTA